MILLQKKVELIEAAISKLSTRTWGRRPMRCSRMSRFAGSTQQPVNCSMRSENTKRPIALTCFKGLVSLSPPLWLTACLICVWLPVHAEIPPQALKQAQDRLIADPQVLDRTDNFCQGRQYKDACRMPGSVFAGGGDGTCARTFYYVHSTGVTTIDLTCKLDAKVVIDRKLPTGGFAYDPARCKMMHSLTACRPLDQMASDQFCREKRPGQSCTAELTHEGKPEQHEGICVQTVEYRGYGVSRAKRDVILCRPEDAVRRTYFPR